MSATAHVLYPDIGYAATITLTAGTTATGYALTDMQDGNMSSTWKSATLTGANTLKIDLGSSQTVGALAILGHNLYSARNAGAAYSDILLEYSADDISYTTVIDSTVITDARITSDLPWIANVTTAARYLRITLTDPVGARAYAPEIAELFVSGAILDLTRPTGLPWTPHDWKRMDRVPGSDTGMGVGGVAGYVSQTVKTEIGKFKIGASFFDDLVPSASYPLEHAAPSFQHFIRTCWSLGGRFVYCPVYDSTPSMYWLEYTVIQTTTAPCTLVAPLNRAASGTAVLFETLVVGPPATIRAWITDWNGTEYKMGNIVYEYTAPSTMAALGTITAVLTLGTGANTQPFGQWIGATVVRAPHGTAKLRTPFVTGWQRKLEMDMVSTGEWMRR